MTGFCANYAVRLLRHTMKFRSFSISNIWGIIVDLRINETRQTGAVENRTYRGAKVFLYFLNSL